LIDAIKCDPLKKEKEKEKEEKEEKEKERGAPFYRHGAKEMPANEIAHLALLASIGATLSYPLPLCDWWHAGNKELVRVLAHRKDSSQLHTFIPVLRRRHQLLAACICSSLSACTPSLALPQRRLILSHANYCNRIYLCAE
jgi:hypothetical protein